MYRDDFELSGHVQDMLVERKISEDWMWRTVEQPDRLEIGADNNAHYIKAIPEHGGRFLRVVINARTTPKRIITIFFDRRMRSKI